MKNSFKNIQYLLVLTIAIPLVFLSSCKDDDDDTMEPAAMYSQNDQMGRPAINTVFNTSDSDKDAFNTTVPSAMGAAFQSDFEARLLALNAGYTTNLLGLDATAFTNVLATDILSVATSGTTTFYDGTNVLTGRALADDVIDVELILIFGGTDAMANPTLTSDNVGANDVAFLSSFPYLANPH